ncbi:MAG: hypothetical protein ACOYNR_09890, partial [Blastocatellia bacterium]
MNILIRNYQLIPGLGSLPPRAVAPAVLTAGCFFLFAMLPGMGEWLVVAAPLPPPSSSAVVKPQPSLSRQSTKSSKKSRNQSASSKKKSSQV